MSRLSVTASLHCAPLSDSADAYFAQRSREDGAWDAESEAWLWGWHSKYSVYLHLALSIWG